jgi:hypothetical protein
VTTIFLLSPAYCGGRRAAMLLKPGSAMLLAVRLREGTLTLGEAFSFLSGLYFRGKMTYARAVAGERARTVLVITPTRGLLPPETPASVALLREFASVDVAADDPRYHEPLARDAAALAAQLAGDARVVLLGSVATGKYVDVLADHFGARLCYPSAFVGRGDMSRGGLLLRSARSAVELDYARLERNVRVRGPRPPKLAPISG